MSDPYWSNVVLAMHMDGVNNSTTFTDLKGKTVTPVGNAKISTTQSKFGGASAYFDGTGDYLSIANSNDLNLSNKLFTIDFFINIATTQGGDILYKDYLAGSFHPSYDLWINGTTLGMSFGQSNGSSSSTAYQASFNFSMYTWYFISIVSDGSNLMFFVDGVLIKNSDTTLQTMVDGGRSVVVGENLNGYIDDLRITKGVARYTSNFTPPTQAFPDSDVTTNSSSMFLVF